MPESRFHTDIQRARAAIMEAELMERPSDRYVAAHLAALRVAAILLAARADPAESIRHALRGLVRRALSDGSARAASRIAATRSAARCAAT